MTTNRDMEDKRLQDLKEDFDCLQLLNDEEQKDLEKRLKKTSRPDSKEIVTYAPFRKNFYVEVPELAQMPQAEVDAFLQQHKIRVIGQGCPKPILSWTRADISEKILKVLKHWNYERPTPIQAQAIPAIMSGRDVIGISPARSGKTFACLLPMFRHIQEQPKLERGHGPMAIIIAPDSQACMRIFAQCSSYAYLLKLKLKTAIIDENYMTTQFFLGSISGAHIVVCTPEKTEQVLASERRCTFLVIYGVDQMIELGLQGQLLDIISQIRPDRQTVLFSANTFGNEEFVQKCLDTPIEIIVGN